MEISTAESFEIFMTNGDIEVRHSDLTETRWAPDQSLAAGVCSWQVRSREANGDAGPWSRVAVVDTTGRTEILSAAIASDQSSIQFGWKPVAAADRFVLQVNRRDESSQIVLRENDLAGTLFLFDGALAAGSYRAWIQAVSSDGHRGPWSREFSFDIG